MLKKRKKVREGNSKLSESFNVSDLISDADDLHIANEHVKLVIRKDERIFVFFEIPSNLIVFNIDGKHGAAYAKQLFREEQRQ